MREPQSVLITGASRGIGRALALAYAIPGCRLGLIARRAGDLARVAGECEARGAVVHVFACDVTETDTLATAIAAFAAHGPVDLAIVSAGIFDGRRGNDTLENADRARRVVDLNLGAAIATATLVAEQMLAGGSGKAGPRGQIALMASLAAWQPAADAPAYSASKAGIAAYGAALREALHGHAISVSVICPGHVASDQTARQDGPLPGIIPAEKAAAIIKRGLEKRRATIAFPRHLAALLRLEQMLPWQLRRAIHKPLRFSVRDGDQDQD